MIKDPPRYLFVLTHSNLSLAEVVVYLEDRGLRPNVIGHTKDILVVEVSKLNEDALMQHLGGTYKIANIACEAPLSETLREERLATILKPCTFYHDLGNKANWGISLYSMKNGIRRKLIDLLEEYFRKKLRQDGVTKAKYFPPRNINQSTKAEESSSEILSQKILAREMVEKGFEILVSAIDKTAYFARTSAVIDHQDFIYRDLGKPVQKSIMGMPPKIARILVNLSGVKPGQVLLDPFCGIGTILIEASIMNIDIRGIDIDARRITDTRLNVEWTTNQYHLPHANLEKKIRQHDARNLSTCFKAESIDGIATEPILVPPLAHYPSNSDARRMLTTAGKTYSVALAEMAKVLKNHGRIAIVVPYIRTIDGNLVSFPADVISQFPQMKLYRPNTESSWTYPLFTKMQTSQKVIRGIYVLQKN